MGSPESGVRFARLMSVFANIRSHHLNPIGKCPKFEVIANLEVESVVNTFAVIIHLKLSHYGNDRLRKRV